MNFLNTKSEYFPKRQEKEYYIFHVLFSKRFRIVLSARASLHCGNSLCTLIPILPNTINSAQYTFKKFKEKNKSHTHITASGTSVFSPVKWKQCCDSKLL